MTQYVKKAEVITVSSTDLTPGGISAVSQSDPIPLLSAVTALIANAGSAAPLRNSDILTNPGDTVEIVFPNLTFALVRNIIGGFPNCASICVKNTVPGHNVNVLWWHHEIFSNGTNGSTTSTVKAVTADNWDISRQPTVGVIDDTAGYMNGSFHTIRLLNLTDGETYNIEIQAASLSSMQNRADIGVISGTVSVL
jgi:hypothetical protein